MRATLLGRPAGSACPIALCCAALALTASTARAQSSTRRPGATPTSIRFTFSGGCAFDEDTSVPLPSIRALADAYNDGRRWIDLQQTLRALLSTCVADDAAKPPHDLSGARMKTMLVVFVTNSAVYYVAVPQRQPYSLTIPGAAAVVPVVLIDAAARRDPPSDFEFTSSRLDDPRAAEIPAFVKDLAAGAIRTYRTDNPAGAKHHPRLWAYAAEEVELPFRRATIAETGTLAVNCDPAGLSDVLPMCPRGRDAVELPISSTWTNMPKRRIDFTAVAGAVVGPYRGHARMKVDAGRYASDPAPHALTMAAVAIHLESYDTSLASMSAPERWSLIVGGTITPAAGVGAGLSIGLVRGLALTAGEALVWVPSGSSPGALAPDGSNQLPHRYSYGTFVGASYRFGG